MWCKKTCHVYICKPLCVDGHGTFCIMLQGWWGTERLESENKENTAEETLRKHDQRNKRSKDTEFRIWQQDAFCAPFIFDKICLSTKLMIENWTDTLYQKSIRSF